MRKAIFAIALLAASGAANAVTATLVAHNQRSSSGTLSTLIWDGSNSVNAWYTTAGVVPSDAIWDWDGSVLSSTGIFQTTSHLGSSPFGSAVISDKVVDMVIDTGAMTTTATSYNCVEGNFLAAVGAHGCANVGNGTNFSYEGTVAYNVGGDANCVNRTIGGDDASTGNPRGLMSIAGGGGCDPTDGAFNLWTIVQAPPASGGTLILSNGIAIADAGTNYLTFDVAAVPAPAGVWLLGTGLGLLGLRRKFAR